MMERHFIVVCDSDEDGPSYYGPFTYTEAVKYQTFMMQHPVDCPNHHLTRRLEYINVGLIKLNSGQDTFG